MNSLIFKQINSPNELNDIPFSELTYYNWESEPCYRPKTYAKLALTEDALFTQLICYEDNPKAAETERDGKIWCDSCLEFFVKPFEYFDEYINIEANSKGVFLAQLGSSRENRRFLKELTDTSPFVSAFSGNDTKGAFWGVSISLSKKLLSECYNIPEDKIDLTSPYVNFYKCGDECEIPHFISMFPVTTLPPGFHNPKCFVKATLINQI